MNATKEPIGFWKAIATVTLYLVVTTFSATAHEGHGTAAVKPVYQAVQAGAATYRVGFAMQPQDALVGEDVRLEFQVLRATDAAATSAPGEPIASGDLQLQIVSATTAPQPVPGVGPGDKPGTYLARYRFDDSGQYGIAVRFQTGADTVAAEFPVVVNVGPVPRTALVLDAIVLLIIGAFLYERRRRSRAATGDTSVFWRTDATFACIGVAVLVIGHLWASPVIGRILLPERHTGAIPWGVGMAIENASTTPHEHPPGTPPHSHDDANATRDSVGGMVRQPARAELSSAGGVGAHEIVSTVVPIPGRMVEVVVPVTARILFEGTTPRVGKMVREGQPLATLEQHYILHDAVHLINQRWLYMVPMMATRRQRLQAELNAARLRHLQQTGDASVRQMLTVTQAVPSADLAAATAKLEEERAAKLLEMHDAQITEEELVRRPLSAPITGIIEAVNFTQGQLKYEDDKLFTILDLSRVWIEARFPGDAVSQPPQRMSFVSSAFPTMPFDGELARIANTLDPESGTLSAFYEVANRDRLLRVGMRLVAVSPSGAATAAVGPSSDVVRRAVAERDEDEDLVGATTALTAVVKPNPEHTAEVTAPLWGRIEFAGRHLAVGDRVRKGDTLLNVVLELSVDERYPMNARGVEIHAELEMAKMRRAQAEEQRRDLIARLKANPKDPLVQEEAQIVEQINRAAEEDEELLTRQAGAYQGTIKRRDPKITPVQAPISGVITEIGFRPGELNRTGDFRKLLTIVDTSRVWLEAPVYEPQSAVLLRDFGRASFTSPGLPAARPLERPVAVSGVVNPTTGALTAIFDVANPQEALKIGATARILVTRK